MGTTTAAAAWSLLPSIIPLREKIGNYDPSARRSPTMQIIPLREKIGNYDCVSTRNGRGQIIPLQEKIGNYDDELHAQPNREIIPLREKIGNYDTSACRPMASSIIPLREKIGNYDILSLPPSAAWIIPLREKIGNYDLICSSITGTRIIPLREKIGNYDLCYWTSPASWKAFWRRARTVSSRNYGVWNWSLKSYRWTDKIPRQNGRPRRFLHAGVRRFLLTLTKLPVLSTPAAMSANLKCSIGIIKADLIFPCYFLSFACGDGVLWYNYFVRL